MPSLVVARNEQFVANFLSILRLAKNLRSLSFSSRWNTSLPGEFLDALRGLDKVEEVDVMGGFNTVHQVYLATVLSLKRLRILISEPDGIEPVPAIPPGYALIDANLSNIVRDEYLHYVLSASSSSLKSLVLDVPLGLTNTGLHSALLGVSKCLVALRVGLRGAGSGPGKDEEHALDSLIVQMVCLERLEITPTIATHLMIERRSEAFQQSRASGSPTTLPIINLKLLVGTLTRSRKNSLLATASPSQIWPGWTIGVYDQSS
ncbi:hypothetical protein JVU11DRAFT_7509 [Chiua virens]|nr:hypothetical protein JVU11DRAFT_7509 [Chiua virens]